MYVVVVLVSKGGTGQGGALVHDVNDSNGTTVAAAAAGRRVALRHAAASAGRRGEFSSQSRIGDRTMERVKGHGILLFSIMTGIEHVTSCVCSQLK